MALFIADTHSLAWYFTKSRKLGRKAFQAFRNSTSGEGIVVVPTVVLAEIMDISEKKRIKVDYEEILEKIEKEVEEAVKEVLRGSYYILGPNVKASEDENAQYCGTKYAVGVCLGNRRLKDLLGCPGN